MTESTLAGQPSRVSSCEPPAPGNLLLRSLCGEDVEAMEASLSRVPLSDGQILIAAQDPIASVYFPEAGVVSFHEVMSDGDRAGVGIIGFEGLVGWSVLLGCERSPHEAQVAIGGATALCVPADTLLELCRERPLLNKLLLLYVQSFVTQMARTISSNLTDRLERRLARWLLMNQDRLGGDEISLTHEQLGVMLGVRRATVTDTLHVLEGKGLIRSLRGRIIIRDRCALIAFAGEAYGAAEQAYSRMIAPFPAA